MVKGRQIAWLVYHHYELSASEGAVLEFSDMINFELKSANLAALMNEWEYCLIGMKSIPPCDIM
eukprot:375351-Karenia_brevis.AAC.1